MIVCSIVVGLLVAAFMMFVAWEHNPQGAFHEGRLDGTVAIHWGDWGLIGLSWLLPVAGVPLLVGALVLAVRTLLDRLAPPAARGDHE